MSAQPVVDRGSVVRLWLHRQGLAVPRGEVSPGRRAFRDHLARTGALQLDPINVVDRAHYLTLWSRFGPFERPKADRWCWRDGVAYEYWGHEASILPISHLPLGRRRMRSFPPESWRRSSWWERYNVPTAAKRRVLRRIREEGPLESAQFERRPGEGELPGWGQAAPLMKENKRALQLLWHEGRLAIRTRRHFRRVYDLAERVYPEGAAARTTEYHDSWLFQGLSGNGIASEAHLSNYLTAPRLKAPERSRVIARNLKKRRIVQVRVEGKRASYYALPEHLARLEELAPARGTHLICPFDSLLWQRARAEQLLDFTYRIEIYVPRAKRQYGYYVLPILHEGRFIGRLDPKLHRDRGELEIKAIHLEADVSRDEGIEGGLAAALTDLATFVGATDISVPRDWRRML